MAGRSQSRRLDNLRDNRAAAVALTDGARRALAILSRDLEAPVYDCEEFLQALQRLILLSRKVRVRIVVVDPLPAARSGHRLIALAQRLPSFIEIRRAGPDHVGVTDAFLVADDAGLLYRPLASRYQGFADTYNPAEAGRQLRRFEEIWAHAEPEPEFRRLRL